MNRLVLGAPVTTALALVVVIANLAPAASWPDPTWLEFDRHGVARGEVWRVVTGNLVHWSPGHLLLDLGAFLAAGVLFERELGRRYPWALAGACLAVALLLLSDPSIERYRGLSAIDAGQYAAALVADLRRSARDGLRSPGRWSAPMLFSIASAVLFAAKLAVECATGRLLLGTDHLGDLGRPLPLAHLAGVIGALSFLAVAGSFARRHRARFGEPRPDTVEAARPEPVRNAVAEENHPPSAKRHAPGRGASSPRPDSRVRASPLVRGARRTGGGSDPRSLCPSVGRQGRQRLEPR